mgnify:CR=1 FL=1
MTRPGHDVVIVGAGQGGLQAAASLRQAVESVPTDSLGRGSPRVLQTTQTSAFYYKTMESLCATVATELIKASEDPALPSRDRLKELVLFSVGDSYFQVRRKLGIAVDS